MFPVRRTSVGLATIAHLAIFAAATSFPSTAHAQQFPPAPVVVSPVEVRELHISRDFIGDVEPLRWSTVGSEVAGLVTEYLVRDGDRVQAGAPLARLRSKPVELALASAEADLAGRRAELAELENGSRKEDIAQAEARERAARTDSEFRAWQTESARRLHGDGRVSDDDLRAAEARAAAAVETLAEATASLALLRAGPRPERIEQARARVLAAETEGARLRDLLERHTIFAPFTGFVSSTPAEVGQWIGIGDPVAGVADIDSIDVLVRVVEDQVGHLRPGHKASVTLRAFGNRTFDAVVAEIVPVADTRTRTFPVRVRVKNEMHDGTPLIKAGMSARVTLGVGEQTTAMVVSKDALVLGGPSPIVYVVQPGADGKPATVAPMPVRVGLAVGNLIEVHGDLKPGMNVVVRGNERLFPGQAVVPTQLGAKTPPAAPTGTPPAGQDPSGQEE